MLGSSSESGPDAAEIAQTSRPLRREIQRDIEDPLSEKILYGEIEPGSVIKVDAIDADGKSIPTEKILAAEKNGLFDFHFGFSSEKRAEPVKVGADDASTTIDQIGGTGAVPEASPGSSPDHGTPSGDSAGGGATI
ncbi:hypothetical protein [Blastococcus sp. Marseille-P5729]|uniref:hypothetical protein n=1 Tax=Blastococcus sp. Marseille-P5729 TaxID=2086582 RepID=UPI0018FE9FBE|nr:hypothetical protein [Blastococcus sp. Marseille-P5729]